MKTVLLKGFPAMMVGALSLVMMFGTSVTMAPRTNAIAKAQSDAQSEALPRSSQSGGEGTDGFPDVDELLTDGEVDSEDAAGAQPSLEQGAQSDQVVPFAPRSFAEPEPLARIPGTHTLIVKTGAYRTGVSASDVNSLNTAGVRFELRVGSATGPLAGVDDCEIQAANLGNCVFEGVPKNGQTYYAVEVAPAVGSPAAATFSEPLTHLGVGAGTATAYAYSQTVSLGGADQTYTIPQLSANTNNTNTASSGFVANRVKIRYYNSRAAQGSALQSCSIPLVRWMVGRTT